MNTASDADRVSARRALRSDASVPLPQFAFPDLDITVEMAVDPDKTLEVMPDPDKTLKRRAIRSADGTQEVRIEDVLEEIPLITKRRAATIPQWVSPRLGVASTQEIQAVDIIEIQDVDRPAAILFPRATALLVLPPPPVAEPRAAEPTQRATPAPPPTLRPSLPLAPSPGAYAYAGPAVVEDRTPRSIAPVEVPMDVPGEVPGDGLGEVPGDVKGRSRAESTFLIEVESDMSWLPRRRIGWVVATATAAAVGLLVAAVTAKPANGDAGAAAAMARPVPMSRVPTNPTQKSPAEASPAPTSPGRAALPQAAPPPANLGVPVVSVDSLPRAPVGTVTGSPEHRLYIDGALMRGYTAVVRCGPHSVKVGSTGRPQTVDVPCGDEIVVR